MTCYCNISSAKACEQALYRGKGAFVSLGVFKAEFPQCFWYKDITQGCPQVFYCEL